MRNSLKLLFRTVKQTTALTTALLISTLLVSACGLVPSKPEYDPIVRVYALQLEQVYLTGIEALLTLEVENPNTTRLAATGFDFQLDVAQTEFASGSSREGINIPAGGIEKIQVPVRFSYTSLLQLVPKLLDQQSFDYVTRGHVVVGPKKIPFKREGSLNLAFDRIDKGI